MKAQLFRMLSSLKTREPRDGSRILEFNTATMDFIFKHKHCPICGQVIVSETKDAYYHVYEPTRCQKGSE